MFGCTTCRVGTTTCPRCSARLCLEHVPFGGEACGECELAYQESRGSLNMPVWFSVGFLLPFLALLPYADQLPSWSARSGGFRAITTSFPMLDILIMVTVTAAFMGKGAMGLREWLHRREFMRAS